MMTAGKEAGGRAEQGAGLEAQRERETGVERVCMGHIDMCV